MSHTLPAAPYFTTTPTGFVHIFLLHLSSLLDTQCGSVQCLPTSVRFLHTFGPTLPMYDRSSWHTFLVPSNFSRAPTIFVQIFSLYFSLLLQTQYGSEQLPPTSYSFFYTFRPAGRSTAANFASFSHFCPALIILVAIFLF